MSNRDLVLIIETRESIVREIATFKLYSYPPNKDSNSLISGTALAAAVDGVDSLASAA